MHVFHSYLHKVTVALCSFRDNTNPALTYARQIIQDIFSDYREGASLSELSL